MFCIGNILPALDSNLCVCFRCIWRQLRLKDGILITMGMQFEHLRLQYSKETFVRLVECSVVILKQETLPKSLNA